MSREILFRGKRRDNSEWVYGSLIVLKNEASIMTPDNPENRHIFGYPDSVPCYPVRPETVGQDTGLKDKNGNRIFEGDILSGHLDDLFPENETRLTVVWHETGWFGWNHGCHAFDDFENQFSRQFEIIGNIHDNPELLKGASES